MNHAFTIKLEVSNRDSDSSSSCCCHDNTPDARRLIQQEIEMSGNPCSSDSTHRLCTLNTVYIINMLLYHISAGYFNTLGKL